MIERLLTTKILELVKQFPVISITGPRQSGKSTLVKEIFPEYAYVTLEDRDTRSFAAEDPRSFLSLYSNKVIIDEAQRVPDLFSYIQGIVDERNEPGQFILSGSQNFLLMESISQSLAGRVAILNLLPFSERELINADKMPKTLNEWLYKGGYPRIYDREIDPNDFYPNYIQTYLERDVRHGSGILKLAEFERFLTLCADRTAEMLNKEELARDAGITTKTVENWLSTLEASFIAFRLQPYYRNYGKRLVKTPKVYLSDTGLACNLLGIEETTELATSSYRGSLFETAVVAEIFKTYHARGRKPKLYYWRDTNQNEVDLIIEKGSKPAALIEVKSSATYSPKFFKTTTSLGELLDVPTDSRFVIYAGDTTFSTSKGNVIGFKEIDSVCL